MRPVDFLLFPGLIALFVAVSVVCDGDQRQPGSLALVVLNNRIPGSTGKRPSQQEDLTIQNAENGESPVAKVGVALSRRRRNVLGGDQDALTATTVPVALANEIRPTERIRRRPSRLRKPLHPLSNTPKRNKGRRTLSSLPSLLATSAPVRYERNATTSDGITLASTPWDHQVSQPVSSSWSPTTPFSNPGIFSTRETTTEFDSDGESGDGSDGSGDGEKKAKGWEFGLSPTREATPDGEEMITGSDASFLAATRNNEEEDYSGSGSGWGIIPDDDKKDGKENNKGRISIGDADEDAPPDVANREEIKRLLLRCAARGNRNSQMMKPTVNVSESESLNFGLDLKVDKCGAEEVRFHPDLNDQYSELFLTLDNYFVHMINRILQATILHDAYLECKVLRFLPGSIIVESVLSFDPSHQLSIDSLKNGLQEAINTNGDGGFVVDAESIIVKDFNECSSKESNGCSLNADCINSNGSYTCRCRSGYLDAAEITSQLPGRACSAICSQDFCQNGGTCLPDYSDGQPKPSCKCDIGYGGTNCEIFIDNDDIDKEEFQRITTVVGVVAGALILVVVIILVIGCCSREKCNGLNMFAFRRRMNFSRANMYAEESMEMPDLPYSWKYESAQKTERCASTSVDFIRYSPYFERMMYKGLDEGKEGQSDRVSTTDSCKALPPSQDGDCDDVISVPDTALLNKEMEVTASVECQGYNEDYFLQNFQRTDLDGRRK